MKVLNFGSLNLDYVYDVDHFVLPGETLDTLGRSVKCGGKGMERCFISKAQLLECTTNPNMCRTQLHLRLDQPLDYFLERSIGNHHVIVRGDHADRLTVILRMLGATPI